MSEVLVGRQPVFSRDLTVYGYELLFRAGDADRADVADADAATGQVVLTAFLEIGLENLVGDARVFINFTRELLLSDACRALPKNRVVVEVPETITADAPVVAALRGLAAAGYVIALDNFAYRSDLAPLVDLCHMAKLDALALGRQGLADHVTRLKPLGVRLVAAKIDSHDDFEYCKRLGCELFQGFFLCRPNVVRSEGAPSNRPAVLRLLARLQQSDVATDELVTAIHADVALAYKLMRYVNSAACGRGRAVGSLHEAVVYVGTNRIRFWASLLLLGGIEDKPRELVSVALHRAKMCDLVGAALGANGRARAHHFTVGLFSVLDALLDRPLTDVVRELNLAEDTADALLHHRGVLGAVLASVLAYESADWDHATCPGVSVGAMKAAYLNSLDWATDTLRGLTAVA